MDKQFDITESLTMDPEFQKWLRISDEIQGFTQNISASARELTEKIVTDAAVPGAVAPAPQPTAQPQAAPAPAAAAPASPAANPNDAATANAIRQLKSGPDFKGAVAAMQTNPALKRVLDTLLQAK